MASKEEAAQQSGDDSASHSVSAQELAYLKTPRAIRERAEAILALAESGQSKHFVVHEDRLNELAQNVLAWTLENYGSLDRVPYHSRYRHLDAGGVDRLAQLDAALAGASASDRLRSESDLVIVSVLLDAGAGAAFTYSESTTGQRYRRSEALAVASFDWFMSGDLAADRATPGRVDAARLQELTEAELERAFQVRADNPLLGVAGRAQVLRRLGAVLGDRQAAARPGDFVVELSEGVRLYREPTEGRPGESQPGSLKAEQVFTRVLDQLSPIWPARPSAPDAGLGDVFVHPQIGLVPFHKLSQWLTYSLCEAIERFGVRVQGLDDLTGLPEYRNGGLLLDSGVLQLKQPGDAYIEHSVDSTLVVEWRALTIALLDRLAERVRSQSGTNRETLPLVKILEGGTWSLGRRLAQERRTDAAPPLRVRSDGTVF